MKIFVTSNQGFVEKTLLAALQSEGHDVCTLVEPSDLSSESAIERAASGCELCIHCIPDQEAHTDRKRLELLYVVGTENVLAAVRRAGVRRVIYLSTADMTLGLAARLYVTEEFAGPTDALSDNIEIRALAEDLVVAASDATLDTIVLRPAWIWGHQEAPTETRIRRSVEDHTFRWIHGGTSLCATTHVRNLVAAVTCAIRVEQAPGEIFYITDDERTTLKEFLTRLSSAMGIKLPRNNQPFAWAYAVGWIGDQWGEKPRRRVAEVCSLGRSTHFNIQHARTVLGYKPVLDVSTGIREWKA
jgi:2-alkyl-3-oxoalkanoate reductase